MVGHLHLGGERISLVDRGAGLLVGRRNGAAEGVLERERDVPEVDRAGSAVGRVRILGHGRAFLTRHGEGELAGDVAGARKSVGHHERLCGGEANGRGRRLVLVLEREAAFGVLDGARQGAVARVDDVDGHAERAHPGRDSNAGQTARDLTGHITHRPTGIGLRRRARLDEGGEAIGGVAQGSEVHAARCVLRAGHDGVGLGRVGELEGELSVRHRPTRELLRAVNVLRGAVRCVTVHKLDDCRGRRLAIGRIGPRLARVAAGCRGRHDQTPHRGVVGHAHGNVPRGTIARESGAGVVLGHGVVPGLAGIGRLEDDLARRCGNGGRDALGEPRRAMRAGDAQDVVPLGGNGEAEHAFSGGGAHELLGDGEAALGVVVKLDPVAVHKRAGAGGKRGRRGERAVAVIVHGHADTRDVRAVGHAVLGRVRLLLADLVLVGARGDKADLSEAYGRRAVGAQVATGHGRGGGDGHRGAGGRGGDLEGERVGIHPVAAFEALGEAEVELGLERGNCVVVLERDLVALLAVNLGRHVECAVTRIVNGDLHRVLSLIVRHAAALVRALRHGLLHGKRVRLAHVVLGKAQSIELCHGALLAGSCGTVREVAVGIGKKCLGRVVAFDREAELAGCHRAAVEHLGHGDARIVGFGDLVGVAEAREFNRLAVVALADRGAGFVGHLLHRGDDGQFAVVFLVGHLDGHAVSGLRDAHAGQDTHVVAVVRAGLTDGVGVGARAGVGYVAEIKRDLGVGRRPLGRRHIHDRRAVLRAFGHGGAVLGGEDEGELVFASPHAARKGLLSRKELLALERTGRLVGVFELRLGGLAGRDDAFVTHGLGRPAVACGLLHLVRPAVQEALNRELLARLQGVRVHAVLVKGQREVLVALDLVAQGHGTGKALAGGIGDANGELELLVREVGGVIAACELDRLGDLEASRALKRELAVIAEPREDLRAGPHGIDEARRGGGDVVGLLSVELVDVGEARRAGLDIGLPGSVSAHIAANAAVAEAKRSHEPLLSRGAVASQIPICAPVVVRLAALQRVCRAGGQRRVLINGRVLADVVVAVGGGRRKARAGVAVRSARPGVGEELDAPASGRMVGQVVRHVGVWGAKKVSHPVLQTRAEEHTDGEGQRRGTRALLGIDAKRAQRDQRCRDLHGHVVTRAGVLRAANLDDDAREVA